MPSINKTPNLGLNQWEGNEYPKRNDFNEDNLILDAKLKELQDATQNIEVPVISVNNKTGAVVLKASDIKLDNDKSIESEINQLFQSVSDGKQIIASAITDMGQTAQGGNTFAQLGAKIKDISKDANATQSQVLSGQTFYQGGNKKTGTMPNQGQKIYTPSTSNITIPEGYHNGTGRVNGDPSLTSANILSGASIFGVSGNGNVVNTGDATAVAGDILSGKTAYKGGGKLTGSMANRGAVTNTITSQGGQYTIPAGYHSGTGKVTANIANLIAGNVKEGVNVGGVLGTFFGGRKVAFGVRRERFSFSKGTNTVKVNSVDFGFVPRVVILTGGEKLGDGGTAFATYSNDSSLPVRANGTHVYLEVFNGYFNIVYTTTANSSIHDGPFYYLCIG